MRDVNWWLMVLAFVLGLLLTFAMMIRRVTREVPVTHTVSAGVSTAQASKPDIKTDLGKVAGAVSAAGTAAAVGVSAKLSDAADKVGETAEKVIDAVGGKMDEAGDTLGAAAAKADAKKDAVSGAIAARFASIEDIEAGPYGKGSAKADADGSGPAGWTIKGNADSMLYHTNESQWYGQTIAEVWFADEESARRAGFLRWDANKGRSAALAVAAIADVPAGPYGNGSAKAGDGGSGPTGWVIKGNADSMLFHGPDSPAYEQTIAEVWFFDETTARAAGFDKWDKNLK